MEAAGKQPARTNRVSEIELMKAVAVISMVFVHVLEMRDALNVMSVRPKTPSGSHDSERQRIPDLSHAVAGHRASQPCAGRHFQRPGQYSRRHVCPGGFLHPRKPAEKDRPVSGLTCPAGAVIQKKSVLSQARPRPWRDWFSVVRSYLIVLLVQRLEK